MCAPSAGRQGHPAYLEELTCPCCIPALGEFSEVPPRGVPSTSLDDRGDLLSRLTGNHGRLVVGCVVVAWLALVAERRIPARVNGVRDAEGAVPEAPVVPGQS